MITFSSKGSFKNTERFLTAMSKKDIYSQLDAIAREGVSALAAATPVDSGLTAYSWNYKIERQRDSVSVIFTNGHVVNGVPVVILLQYGHGTGSGGYVQGRDFINPAIKPIFDRMEKQIWKAVTSA